jgi:formylglycine-generating enzyme required for sulfatase activity
MTDQLAGSVDDRRKTRVFISYSRVDLEFALRIVAALEAQRFEVLIDVSSIEPSEKWWQRIKDMITQADTLVFVLSPEAVASKVCEDEVEFAASLNKRFVPIVCRRVDASDVPETLRELNWLLFDDPQRFDQSVIQLTNTLQSDVRWLRKHTQFTEFAQRWQAAGRPGPGGLMLRPPLLPEAEALLIAPRPPDSPDPALLRDYVAVSRQAFDKELTRARRVRAAIYGLASVVIIGLIGWINRSTITDQWHWWTVTRPYAEAQVWPHVLAADEERALKPGQSFKECAQDCPEMVVVPAGSFAMGSSREQGTKLDREVEQAREQKTDLGRTEKILMEQQAEGSLNETPQHLVTIAKPFAVAKFELTFADWDACVTGGGCDGYKPFDPDMRRGKQPVVNVTQGDARSYLRWLSAVTGKTYRLLSEAEYEYATRAGTTTLYPWGDEMPVDDAPCFGCAASPESDAKANCNGCGTGSGGVQEEVGIFPANKFGLYDMVGNVSEWTEDCYHDNYTGAPADGSAWLQANGGDCNQRIVRGGSWSDGPDFVRSASRYWMGSTARNSTTGFRVGRTLLAPAVTPSR